ncbi:U-scoloptoxin(01)-Cw1a-like [Macrobrachium rosenbergii]|uniref:U-scoloptoxin(01)-Cw1a-like n=1 Tax=Macrobrachium rosenbergii TaxID=79674 RepID=UPI0034D55F93
MKAVFILLATIFASASARSAYILPAGAELLTNQIVTTFNCNGRPYGFYADVANDCAIFHVCYPINDATGSIIEEAQFSFICGNQTIFSQESLTCTFTDDAFPCDQAETLYDLSNADFGTIPEVDVE